MCVIDPDLSDALILYRDGPDMSLIEHFLRKGVLSSVVEGLLPTLCEIAHATVEPHLESKIGTPSYLNLAWVRPYGYKVFGRCDCFNSGQRFKFIVNKPAAHLAQVRMALVKAYCHPSNDAEAEAILQRLLDTKETKSAWHADYLHQTLMALDDNEDATKEFKTLRGDIEDKLRQHVIQKRTGLGRQKMAAVTPESIKLLKPDISPEMRGTTPLSTVLVWQASAHSFFTISGSRL